METTDIMYIAHKCGVDGVYFEEPKDFMNYIKGIYIKFLEIEVHDHITEFVDNNDLKDVLPKYEYDKYNCGI